MYSLLRPHKHFLKLKMEKKPVPEPFPRTNTFCLAVGQNRDLNLDRMHDIIDHYICPSFSEECHLSYEQLYNKKKKAQVNNSQAQINITKPI